MANRENPFFTRFESAHHATVGTQLGQAWLGNSTARFFTLIDAHLSINNNVQLRQRDMTASAVQAIAPGPREVTADFTVFAQDDAQTTALYAIAKQKGTISLQLQIGSIPGQMMSVYVPSVTPELPLFNDTTERLQWHFRKCAARGVSNDELFLAFA